MYKMEHMKKEKNKYKNTNFQSHRVIKNNFIS
jgi:hypothetical protein